MTLFPCEVTVWTQSADARSKHALAGHFNRHCLAGEASPYSSWHGCNQWLLMSRCCCTMVSNQPAYYDLWPLTSVSQHFFSTQLPLTLLDFLSLGPLVGTVPDIVATVFVHFCCLFHFMWQAEFGDFSASHRERAGLSRCHTGTRTHSTKHTKLTLLTNAAWVVFLAVEKCCWLVMSPPWLWSPHIVLSSVLHQPQARPPGPTTTTTTGDGGSLGTACCQRRADLGTAPGSRRGRAAKAAQLRFGQWDAAMNMDTHENSPDESDVEHVSFLDCWQLFLIKHNKIIRIYYFFWLIFFNVFHDAWDYLWLSWGLTFV